MDAVLFENISIVGRFAFSVTCLEQVCKVWNIKNIEMDNLIDFLWTFTLLDFDSWECDLYNIIPLDIFDMPEQFGFVHLEKEKEKILLIIFYNIFQFTSMKYNPRKFKDRHSLLCTLKIGSLLEENSIELPDLKPFPKSKITEYSIWGSPASKSYFKE